MSRENYRTVGAIAGLLIGLGLMWITGVSGMIPGAIFGASGAVLGGISGEQMHARIGGRG
ncbi:MAG: hypothetical protein AAGA03_02805 [Planctomycetota bacterium]